MDGGGLARGGIYWKKKKGKRVRERLRNLFEVLGTITVKKKKKKKKERERGAEECAAE